MPISKKHIEDLNLEFFVRKFRSKKKQTNHLILELSMNVDEVILAEVGMIRHLSKIKQQNLVSKLLTSFMFKNYTFLVCYLTEIVYNI